MVETKLGAARLAMGLLALTGLACSDGNGSGEDGTAGAAGASADGGDVEEPGVEVETTPWPTAPGDEFLALCEGWHLENEESLFVNRIELEAITGMHHSDWFVLPEGMFPGGFDGMELCEDAQFDLFASAFEGTVLFAQSTQSKFENQDFGDGAAVEIPPHSDLYVFLHILNTTPEPLEPTIKTRLYTVPEDEVDVKLKDLSFNMGRGALAIPPREKSRFYADCAFPEGSDFSARYILPHYHYWGTGMEFSILGGPDDGTLFWKSEGVAGEALAGPVDPPVSFAGATGLRFACLYDNPDDTVIEYSSSGDGEMCFFLMHTDADQGFYTIISEGILGAEITDMGYDEEGIHNFEVGPCIPASDAQGSPI